MFKSFALTPSKVVIAISLAAMATGCASTQLGPPPTDVDLRNDGTDGEQDALYDKYQLGYNGDAFVRPAAEKISFAGILVSPQAKPESDSARNYITSSEKAADLYDGPLLWTHRILGTGLPYYIADGAILATGTVGGAAVGAALGASSGDASQILSGAACGGVVGGFIALMTGGACVGVGYQVVRPVIGLLAINSYRETATAFNADLRSKIAGQANGSNEVERAPDVDAEIPPPPLPLPPPEDVDDAPPPPPDPYAENPTFAY